MLEQVGDCCILNNNALIEHDAVIGDYCHVSTGVLVNGGASIGHSSFVAVVLCYEKTSLAA